MKLVICICTYNRNSSLIKCLRSVDRLYKISNIKIEIQPNPNILKMIQNKWTQHEFYRETGLPVPCFESLDIWRPHFENGIVLKTKYFKNIID